MRKLIFGINLTLDGYIDHTAGVVDDEMHERAATLLESADVILYGRVMYELMADYWPKAPEDKTLTPAIRRFADVINRMDKVVYSKSLEHVEWKTRIARGVDAAEIQKMKQQPGRNILLGGGAILAQAFMDLDLIDEYHFWIHPVLWGRGKRLIGQNRYVLKLVEYNRMGSGVMEMIYRAER